MISNYVKDIFFFFPLSWKTKSKCRIKNNRHGSPSLSPSLSLPLSSSLSLFTSLFLHLSLSFPPSLFLSLSLFTSLFLHLYLPHSLFLSYSLSPFLSASLSPSFFSLIPLSLPLKVPYNKVLFSLSSLMK